MNQEAGNCLGEACIGSACIAMSRMQGESGPNVVCLTLEREERETKSSHKRDDVILLVQEHLKSIGLGLCGLS